MARVTSAFNGFCSPQAKDEAPSTIYARDGQWRPGRPASCEAQLLNTWNSATCLLSLVYPMAVAQQSVLLSNAEILMSAKARVFMSGRKLEPSCKQDIS